MKKYSCTATIETYIEMIVEAESEEDALEKANNEFGGACNYCGNGGTDKLVGVDGENESISINDDVEFDEATELEE